MIQFDEYFFQMGANQPPTCQENVESLMIPRDSNPCDSPKSTFNFFFAVAAVGGGNPTSQLAGDFGLV